MPLDPGPELSNLLWRDEAENVIRLRLPHQLPHEVSAHVGIRMSQSRLELLEGQVAIPEKVGPTL